MASMEIKGFLQELVGSLALVQFLLVYMVYGFGSIASINLPYTDTGFLVAFLLLLVLPCTIIGAINLAVEKKRRAGRAGDLVPAKVRGLATTVLSYAIAVTSIMLFMMNGFGWRSEAVPVFLFMAGGIASGLLAAMHLPAIDIGSGGRATGLGMLVALGVTGISCWLFTARGLGGLAIAELAIVLAIPPLDAISGRAGTTRQAGDPPAPAFTTFDKGLSDPLVRGWVSFALVLMIVQSTSVLFHAIFYLKVPEPAFQVPVLMYFAGAGAGAFLLGAAFKGKPVNGAIAVTIALQATWVILAEAVPRSSYSPAGMLVAGAGLGATLVLFLRFQPVREAFAKPPDTAAARVAEITVYTFLAALVGLLSSMSLTWASLEVDIDGYAPARVIIHAVLLVLACIGFLVARGGRRYAEKVERGEISRKATTMQELLMQQALGGSRKAAKPAMPGDGDVQDPTRQGEGDPA